MGLAIEDTHHIFKLQEGYEFCDCHYKIYMNYRGKAFYVAHTLELHWTEESGLVNIPGRSLPIFNSIIRVHWLLSVLAAELWL